MGASFGIEEGGSRHARRCRCSEGTETQTKKSSIVFEPSSPNDSRVSRIKVYIGGGERERGERGSKIGIGYF